MADAEKKYELTFVFDNERARYLFAVWMCDAAGEQDYWNFMEHIEKHEKGPITAVEFNYHVDDDGRSGEERFIADGRIRTECGRLDDEEDIAEDGP